ncbi:MAG: RHS repeat-associated core domain-containing protein [Bdellovibrionota bacterium]|nr:RHS repeat-associated core domain-containing protein [Bdellovibrionota bacterium]
MKFLIFSMIAFLIQTDALAGFGASQTKGISIKPDTLMSDQRSYEAGATATLTGEICATSFSYFSGKSKCRRLSSNLQIQGFFPDATSEITDSLNIVKNNKSYSYSFTTPELSEENENVLKIIVGPYGDREKKLIKIQAKLDKRINFFEKRIKWHEDHKSHPLFKEWLTKIKNKLELVSERVKKLLEESPNVLAQINIPLQVGNQISRQFYYSSIFNNQKISLEIPRNGSPIEGESVSLKARLANMNHHKIWFPEFEDSDSGNTFVEFLKDRYKFNVDFNGATLFSTDDLTVNTGDTFEKEIPLNYLDVTQNNDIRFELFRAKKFSIGHFSHISYQKLGELTYDLPISPDRINPTLTEVSPSSETSYFQIFPPISALMSDEFGRINKETIKILVSNEQGELTDYTSFSNFEDLDQERKFKITADLSGLIEGIYDLQLKGSDFAGNEVSVERSFRVDRTDPIINLANNDNVLTNNPDFGLNLQIDDLSPVEVSVLQNGLEIYRGGEASFTIQTTLVEGQNTFEIYAIDAAGNVADPKLLHNIELDTIPPEFLSLTPREGTNVYTLDFNVSGTSNEPLSRVKIQNQESLLNGEKVFSNLITAPAEGVFLYSVSLTDLAGNTNEREVFVGIVLKVLNQDLVTLVPDENSGGIIIRGLPGAARAGVEVEIDAGFFNSKEVVANNDGSFSASMNYFTEVTLSATDANLGRTDSFTLSFNADTTLSGIIKDYQKNPLPGVTVTLLASGQSAVTDGTGSFQIPDPATGDQILRIDGSSVPVAIRGEDKEYSAVNISVSLGNLQLNILDRPIYLVPVMKDGSETKIENGLGAVVTSSFAPGVELDIPSGVTRFPNGGNSGSINMMEIPVEVTSIEPLEVAVPDTVVALEPSGLEFTEPVQLTLPNINEFPAGMQAIILSKNSKKGIWEIDGIATVSSDGQRIVTNDGEGITHFSEVYAAPVGPTVKQIGAQDQAGADTFNGALSTSVSLPSFKIYGEDVTPSLSYKSTWANPNVVVSSLFDVPRQKFSFANSAGGRSLFGSASVDVNGETWIEPDFITAEFQSGDIYSGPMRFTGLPNKAVVSYSFSLANQNSGIQPYSAKYKAHLKRQIVGTRTIRTKKLFGRTRTTQEHFAETRAVEQVYPSDLGGPLYIQNKIMSEAGQGWKINSAQRIYRGDGPRVMIEESNGGVSSYFSTSRIETLFSHLEGNLRFVNFDKEEMIIGDSKNSIYSIDYKAFNRAPISSWPNSYIGQVEVAYTQSNNVGSGGLKHVIDVSKQRQVSYVSKFSSSYYGVDSTGSFSKLNNSNWSDQNGKSVFKSIWLTSDTLPTDYRKWFWSGNPLYCGSTTNVGSSLCGWYGLCTQESNGLCSLNTFNATGLKSNFVSPADLLSDLGGLDQEKKFTSSKFGFQEGKKPIFNNPTLTFPYSDTELLVIDTGNNRLRIYNTDSETSETFAGNGQTYDNGNGGTASQASIFHPRGLARDASGNIYVSSERGFIRRIDTNGRIFAFAGKTAGQGGVLDDVVHADDLLLSNPTGMVVDNENGHLYVADTGHHRVVRIDFLTKTATVVAGSGSCINSPNIGDGGSAVNASLCNPKYLGLDDNNNLLIADNGHNKIRKVTFGASSDGASRFLANGLDNSELFKLNDGSFERVMRDGTRFFFNSKGLQTSSLSRTGREIVYDYDSSDRLIREKDLTTGAEVNYYYSGDYLSSIVDPANRTTTFINEGGRLTQINFPDGTTRKFVYNEKGLLVQEVNQRNIALGYEYNQFDRLTKVIRADGTELVTNDGISSTIGNNFVGGNEGQLKSVGSTDVIDGIIDAKGNETKFSKDENGFVTEIIDAKDQVTTVLRDLEGRAIKMTRPDGSEVFYTYDDETSDLLEKVDTGSNSELEYLYDSYGSLLARTNTRGEVSVENTYHEDTGVLLEYKNILGQKTTYTYNNANLISSITNNLNQTQQFEYDSRANISKTISPGGREEVVVRNNAGFVTSRTDANGDTHSYTYDTFNRLTSVTTPKNLTTSYEYLPTGQLEKIIDPLNNTTLLEYDIFGRLVKKTDPLGATRTYSYDKNGNVVQEVDPAGNVKEYVYNELDQLTQKLLPDNTYLYQYNLRGNVVSIENEQSLIQYAYTRREAGELVREMHFEGVGAHDDLPTYNLTMDYDSEGNRVYLNSPVGEFDYSYDMANRLTRLINHKEESFEYFYDQGNRLIEMTRPGSKTSFTFDNENFLSKMIHSKLDNTELSFFEYSRDNIGNATRKRTPAGDYDFTYDGENQVTNSTSPSMPAEFFEYDDLGNRTRDKERNFLYGPKGYRLLEDSLFNYSYDPNGNLIGKVAKSGVLEEYYEFNSENQLIKVTMRENGATTKVISMVYDALGRRVKKKVENLLDASKNQTRYFGYDGPNLLFEADENKEILASYTSSGLGADDYLSKYVTAKGQEKGLAKSEGSYFYLKDGLNSVSSIVKGDGSVAQKYEYNVFGNLYSVQDSAGVDISSSPELSPYITFTGREYDSELNMLFFRARYYDYNTGRFLSEDGYSGNTTDPKTAINKYTFNHNDPVNRTDPSGNISFKGILETGLYAFGGSLFGNLGSITAALYNVNTSNEFSDGERTFINTAAIAVASFGAGMAAGFAVGAAIGLYTGTVATVAIGAMAGAVVGGIVGGAVGGGISVLSGGAFSDGVANGILIGMIAGAIGGGLGAYLGAPNVIVNSSGLFDTVGCGFATGAVGLGGVGAFGGYLALASLTAPVTGGLSYLVFGGAIASGALLGGGFGYLTEASCI